MKFNIIYYFFSILCCLGVANAKSRQRYLLYDVNYGEGFNLKRDVYIRMANLVRFLNQADKISNWILVLPPFGRVYHWHSPDISSVPWSIFFDLDKLNLFVPVIEFEKFIQLSNESSPIIDEVFHLRNLPFEDGSSWQYAVVEDSAPKNDYTPYRIESDGTVSGYFFGYENVRAKHLQYLSIMAEVAEFKQFLLDDKRKNSRAIMLDRAETLIHGHYSEWSPEFWTGRRSMVFSEPLRQLGDQFRKQYLNSNDEKDRTVPPSPNYDWRVYPWPRAPALGGPYLAVHLRRGDMMRVPGRVPSLEYAAKQIVELCREHGLTTVFIASDATDREYESLRSDLTSQEIRVFRQKFTESQLRMYTPGGEAIVDQWICIHARVFAGTRDSTFSYRIAEEREIMGFRKGTSHYVICADGVAKCEQATRWEVKLEPAFTISGSADNKLDSSTVKSSADEL